MNKRMKPESLTSFLPIAYYKSMMLLDFGRSLSLRVLMLRNFLQDMEARFKKQDHNFRLEMMRPRYIGTINLSSRYLLVPLNQVQDVFEDRKVRVKCFASRILGVIYYCNETSKTVIVVNGLYCALPSALA